jgi:hypothetical protein
VRASGPIVASFVTLAALLAACGGDGEGATSRSGEPTTHEDYQQAIGRIEQSTAVREAGDLFYALAAGDVSHSECREAARRFADDVHEIVEDVAALTPPADIDDLHDRLLDEARATSTALDALASDVEAGEVGCGQEWNARAYGLASTDRARVILVQYTGRGYRLGVNGQ